MGDRRPKAWCETRAKPSSGRAELAGRNGTVRRGKMPAGCSRRCSADGNQAWVPVRLDEVTRGPAGRDKLTDAH
jgi:hypothetical protein